MEKYAILNSSNIAETIVTYNQPLQNPLGNYIKVEDDLMLWHKYESGVWSTEKFEPTSTAPLSEFEQLKQNNATLSQTLGNVTLENANLKQQVETLTQTVANLMVGGTN